nr:uncharacterized mitochondrial protein AtMg00810-like [Tanacetum cinerariifolium]
NQLRSDGDMCMYALSVSTMKPKNVKEAMTDPAWIDSMHEELLHFKRLDVYVDDIIFGSTHPRPDIVYATYLCARYQAKPTEKHLKEVKRIFRYLRGTVNTGLWYTKEFGFELTGFSDANYEDVKTPSRVPPVELNS